MSRTRRPLAAALVLIAVMAAAACGGEDEGAGTTAAPDAASVPAETTAPGAGRTAPVLPSTTGRRSAVRVYFTDADGRLVAEERPAPGGASTLRAALDALAAGPSAPGLSPALPEGTGVLSADVEDGLGRADLTREFEERYPPGGAAAELGVLAPLVRTAVDVPGVSRLLVTVEGEVPAPAGSQFDLSEPLAPEAVPPPTP